jgi:DNA repair exonuclease SbcCD nuclease subunit
MTSITSIIIGDIHIKHDNIPEIEKFIYKLELLCIEKNPDFIILLGDILDRFEKIYTPCLNIAYNLVDRLRKISRLFILIGNHDMVNNQQFLTDNHCFNGLKQWHNVTVVDKVISTNINNIELVLSPYVFPGRFVEALNTLETDWKSAKVIFAHQEFKGCKMGSIISVEGDEWPIENPPIISGHIHGNQTIENIYYPGSSTQVAFGETSKNIIAFATFTEDRPKYTLEEIDLKLPKKKIIYKDVEDLEDYEIKDSPDKIKLSISGSIDSFKSFKKTKKYKDILDKGVKIVFKPKRIEILEKKDKEIISEDNNFKNILLELVKKDNNKNLLDIYNILINEK